MRPYDLRNITLERLREFLDHDVDTEVNSHAEGTVSATGFTGINRDRPIEFTKVEL